MTPKEAAVFGVGAASGLAIAITIWTFWKDPAPAYRNIPGYDACLFLHSGNKDTCDALMRITARPK